jgi:phosphatidylglycerol---prolipoprotein diacylglyceryl transferase
MHPILFKLGPLTLHSYGFFMAVGVVFALWFLYRQGQKQGLDATKLLDASFYIMIVSLLGAKLVLLAGSFSYYIQNPKELFWVAKSGGVFQGGLFFGIVFALWYLRRKRIPTWKTADIAAPALALGHGFGRIGCFMAGCCYGKECVLPWGATFHDEYAHNLTGIPLNESLHPVQLYEAALNFLNFLVLFFLLRKKKFDGQIFPLYVINYSLIRYFTEFFRGDHSPKAILLQGSSALLTVSYPQFFCILGLIAGVALYVIFKKRQRA